jgi:hypothetical protein
MTQGLTAYAVAVRDGNELFQFLTLARQSRGLYLVWAHDMDGLIDWIKSQS